MSTKSRIVGFYSLATSKLVSSLIWMPAPELISYKISSSVLNHWVISGVLMGYFISASSHMNHTLVLGQMVLSSIFKCYLSKTKSKLASNLLDYFFS